MSPDDDLGLLAERVRNLYWAARLDYEHAATGQALRGSAPSVARWDGGTSPDGRRYSNVWPKIAAHLAAQGVPPAAAMRALFGSARGGVEAPWPTALLKPDLADRLAAYAEKEHSHALAAINAEKVTAGSRLARLQRATTRPAAEIVGDVVRSCLIDISPLLRLCLARQAGQPNLAADYEEAAFTQYADCPNAYEAALGPSIPESFRGRLLRLRDHVKGSQ
jgi:hypothetical protein